MISYYRSPIGIMLLVALISCNPPEFSREDPQGVYEIEKDIRFSLCEGKLTSTSLPAILYEVVESKRGSSIVLPQRIDLTNTPKGLILSVVSNKKTFMPIVRDGRDTAFLFVNPKTESPVLAKRVRRCLQSNVSDKRPTL